MRANKDWRKLYFNYVRSYNKMNKELINKFGVGMSDKKLSYWSWKDVYGGLENARLSEQAAGTRGKSLNINRDILAHQKFKISYDQGKALLKAKRNLLKKQLKLKQRYSEEAIKIRQELKEINLEKLRMGLVDLEDVKETMKAINEDLKFNPDYADSYDRAEAIGQLIFGS